MAFRRTFEYAKERNGKWYDSKQVLCVVAEEPDQLVVVTVLVFYIQEENMRITYDPHADAAYIYFEVHPRTPGCVSRTEQLSDCVNVDYAIREDGQDEVIGVEILSAGGVLGLSKKTRDVGVEILGQPLQSNRI